MKFEELLAVVGHEAIFDSSLLLAGSVDQADLQRQLSRWTTAGRLIQLRRGVYALAAPYRKTTPHPFHVANRLVVPSYVSLESALSFHGLVPELVAVTTSVTTSRPGDRRTALGRFTYQHIKQELFHGYERTDLADGQQAFVATPEKALLDLVQLRRGGATAGYLDSLRLQHLDRLDRSRLGELARRAGRPQFSRAVEHLERLIMREAQEFEPL